MTKIKNFLSLLGPGILFAGAAIGGSHLVQSTRAGALYGFTLLGVVILANIVKYPFFEFAQRYTADSQKSLLDGYYELHHWWLHLFTVFALISMVPTIAAVSFVSASILSFMTGGLLSVTHAHVFVIVICAATLVIGHYRFLDLSIKVLLLILSGCVIFACAIAVFYHPRGDTMVQAPSLWSWFGFSFLLALIGWMPAPMDASAWTSLWTTERAKETKRPINFKETILDFRVGYIGTAVLAVFFLVLGAVVMHTSGEDFAAGGTQFSQQLISLFGRVLGFWSETLIAVAAFATMFSTALTCMDAYPRVLSRAFCIPKQGSQQTETRTYWLLLTLASVGALLLGIKFVENMKGLVDLATILAFLTAPVFALMNYRIIRSHLVSTENKPSRFMISFSQLGLLLLTVLSLVYLVCLILSEG